MGPSINVRLFAHFLAYLLFWGSLVVVFVCEGVGRGVWVGMGVCGCVGVCVGSAFVSIEKRTPVN